MSKSILTIDTPKGCMFCPIVTVVDRQPYLGFTCPFCNGLRYVYDLRAEEVLTYKFEDCPLKEAEETQS